MDRYQKVEKRKPESAINDNEIRITSHGLLRNYISYSTSFLQERHGKEIVFKAMGQAISKAVAIVEIIKRRFHRLHQDTVISSVSITDVWEPIEEGLETVEQTRLVSMISITLSTKALNENSPGYQAPSYVEQGRRYYYQSQQQPPRQSRAVFNSGNEDSFGRGRGHGRGRGRGWGRGGYGNYQGEYQRNFEGDYEGNYQRKYPGKYQGNYQENSGYTNWGRGGGRGGWGYRGSGYGRSRDSGGRVYGRGRGRMGNRGPRGGGNQA